MFDDSINIFKCLADKSRLLIISNLLQEPMYVELLSQRLELTPSTVSFHLKKLETCNIVSSKKEQYYTMYYINEEILNSTLRSFFNEQASNTEVWDERQNAYREKIIKSFFEYGKLKSIPVQRKKRRIILEEILQSFDVGKEYKERDVNIIIADYHDDFCTIRREMISEGLMTRNNGIYIRKENK
jgi:hypothetical protein